MTTTDAFLDELEHPRLDHIRELRSAILDAEPALTESIKWNAPNFLYGGEDRVTLRIHPGDVLQVILHRGAKPQAGVLRVDAPAGLVRWASGDRGILTAPADGFDEWLRLATPVIAEWARLP